MQGGLVQQQETRIRPARFAASMTFMALGLALMVGAVADGTVITSLQLRGAVAVSPTEFGGIAVEVLGNLIIGGVLVFVGSWLLPGAIPRLRG